MLSRKEGRANLNGLDGEMRFDMALLWSSKSWRDLRGELPFIIGTTFFRFLFGILY